MNSYISMLLCRIEFMPVIYFVFFSIHAPADKLYLWNLIYFIFLFKNENEFQATALNLYRGNKIKSEIFQGIRNYFK